MSNTAIPFFIQIRYQEPFHVIEISENRGGKNGDLKKNAIVSQVRNSMEMKFGQLSFQLSEVLQKYIHTMQMNLRFIVTLVEGYIPVVIGSKAIMHE